MTQPKIPPSNEELFAKIADIYEQLAQGLESASQELLAEPHGLALLQRTSIQTKGHFVSHLIDYSFCCAFRATISHETPNGITAPLLSKKAGGLCPIIRQGTERMANGTLFHPMALEL